MRARVCFPTKDKFFLHIQHAYDNRRPLPLSQITVFHRRKRDHRAKSCLVILMEEGRIDVPGESMAEFLAFLIALGDEIPAHFILNMDKMGDQDWANRKPALSLLWPSSLRDAIQIVRVNCIRWLIPEIDRHHSTENG
jgi:hypothetical protein